MSETPVKLEDGYGVHKEKSALGNDSNPTLAHDGSDICVEEAKACHVLDTDGSQSEFQTLGRWRAAVIMFTIEVGIGILSLPAALSVLGLIPGIIAITGFGLLTTYCGCEMLQFYRRYPMVTNMVECARYIGGPMFENVFATAFMLCLSLICASANITLSVALNTLSGHSICTVAFIAFPLIFCWLLCIPRTMGFVAYCGWACTVSIMAAVLIVMISLGVSGPHLPPGATVTVKLVGNPSFRQIITACLNIAFAYSGNQSFITVMHEMRDASKDFVPALAIQKVIEIATYITVAVVVYVLAGDHVTSPALGSAAAIPAKIAYGILIPSVLGTGLVMGHTGIKYLYFVIMQHVSPSEIEIRNKKTWGIWIGCGTIFWIVTFVIANAVPLFDSILNITAALFISWFTFGVPAIFWLHLNWERKFMESKRMMVLSVINWGIVLLTLFMNAAGLYASISTLVNLYNNPNSNINGPFTCNDNSSF